MIAMLTTLATVTKQQQEQGDDILDDDESYPLICGSDRSSTSKVDSNVAGPSKSKWAHPLNLEKITADRNKTDSKKLQNLNKLSAKLTKSSPSKKEATNQKQYNSAVRALTAPTSDPSAGFTYVYYPSKARTSRAIQRKNLMALGVTNGRVLDIHYPARNVIAILVHNDYKHELIQHLERANVHQLADFSPLDPSTIKDPKYNHLDVADRTRLAAEKHTERLIRALPHIRIHMCRAVAHFFFAQSWISETQLTNFLDSVTQKFLERKAAPHSPTATSSVGPTATSSVGATNPPTNPPTAPSSLTDNTTASTIPTDDTVVAVSAEASQNQHNMDTAQETIDSIIFYCNSVDMLFITETWLPPGTMIPTHWQQFHIYGLPVPNSLRHQMGISLFINPDAHLPKLHVDTQSSNYYMRCHVDNLQIYCFYLPPDPSLDNTTTMQILESLPITANTILCGDLNSRMGKRTGDSRWNTRGSKISSFIGKRNIYNWNAKLQYGIPTRIHYLPQSNTTETSIVDYFLSQSDLAQPSLKIRTDLAVLGSDHKMMEFSFLWADQEALTDDQTETLSRKRWKVQRLLEPSVCDAYITTLQRQFYQKDLNNKLRNFVSYLSSLTTTPPTPLPDQVSLEDTIEFYTQEFYDCIYYALNTILTVSEPRPKTWQWFWNKSLQTAANRRQACYTRWRKSRHCIQAPLWWHKYKEADAALKAQVKLARSQAFHNFCDDLDADPSAAMPTIKRILQSKTRSKFQYSSIHGPQHAVNDMADYLAGIYDGHLLPQPKNIPFNQHHSTPMTNPSVNDSYDFSTCPFDIKSTFAAIKRLPRNKSPGSDHITSEMLKPVAHIITPILTNLFRACWLVGFTPQAWRKSQVVPLYKKGDPLDPANYRPISLTSHFRKAMEYCLQSHLYEQTPFIDIAQGGFKPHLSALDQAVCLDEIMHRYHQKYMHYPTVAFLDIAKAYDCVDRDVIWNTLSKHCDPYLLDILQNLFDDVHVEVINGNYKSHSFKPSTGVLQGSVLSPHLYSIFINSLPHLLRPSLTDHNDYDTADIQCLLFADDVALISSSANMQHLLDMVDQHSILHGYRWSPTKCAILEHPTTLLPSYTLYDIPIPTAPSFKYLGMHFNYRGMNTQLFIDNTKTKVETTMRRIHQIGARTSGFSLPLSIKIYCQFVRPQIEYGLCITNINATNKPALERIQDDCLRLIVGGFRNSSVKSLRVMANLPSMVERWYTLNSKYTIRLSTMPEDSLIYLINSTNTRYSRLHLLQKKNLIYQNYISAIGSSTSSSHSLLKSLVSSFRSQAIIDSTDTMIRACRSDLIVDPILTLPMTRKERRRLLRWRMNWLPGMKTTCYCGGDMSRNHILTCPAIPEPYWDNIQRANGTQHPIDYCLKQLPIAKPKTLAQKQTLLEYWQPRWSNLLNILLIVDQIAHKAQETFAAESDIGELLYTWITA
ncbi:hypothetical protein [Parasitella parasitica]|uniref:Reverse transcriptase domain-containing protein n=1 Tax=Parasitella parasitica TaxID=35722 RepID=A0A0B7NAL6_9FUNG|nr:hypothetical protein [Parasitella parasitica]